MPANLLERTETTEAEQRGAVDELPDSAFAHIEPGGTQDDAGRTTPRSLRHFPHHSSDGAVDRAQLRTAIARIPRALLPDEAKGEALAHVRRHARALGVSPARSGFGDAEDHAAPPAVGVERRLSTQGGEIELRAAADGGMPTITGYAALFNVSAEINTPFGSFREVIKPGAFTKSIARDDVRALFNHDDNFVLGRTSRGTLRLEEDADGLFMDISPPDTQAGRDVAELVRRGDVSGASFGFIPERVQWTPDQSERQILEARLIDVSPVTYPAYDQTEVYARSIAAWAQRSLAGGPLAPAEIALIQRAAAATPPSAAAARAPLDLSALPPAPPRLPTRDELLREVHGMKLGAARMSTPVYLNYRNRDTSR